jgi:DnaJ domain
MKAAALPQPVRTCPQNGVIKSGLPKQRKDGQPVSAADRAALKTLGLDVDADRKTIRARYTALARQYHPDRNGGDRTHEKKLQAVIDAYQTLRESGSFS